jgi:exopolysaccharide biosynthesis polyprenyl glycosylphosphotransferase
LFGIGLPTTLGITNGIRGVGSTSSDGRGLLRAMAVGSYMTRDAQTMMQWWRRIATAVDVFALLAAALLAALATGHGHVSAADAWLVAIDVSFVLVAMRTRARRVSRLQASALDGCAEALKVCSLGALLALATAAILGADRPVPVGPELWLLTAVAVCAARVAMQLAQHRARRRGALMTPTLVVGAGVVGGHEVVRRLLGRPECGLRPVGFLDADPAPRAVDADLGVPVLGGPDALVDACSETGARHVILAFAYEADHRLGELVKRCQELKVGVSVVPRLYESVSERGQLDHVGGLPLFSPQSIDPRGRQFAAKHAIDRVIALLGLIVLSPMLLALALAVRLSSPGPVIFRQRRVGRDGHVFEVLKFRTMLAGHGGTFTLRADVAPGGIEGPDRRTRVGRWLRSSSLDELPQLVNVLRGEMSLIGPRPERPEFAARFAREIEGYDDRHRVRSGITGWAQANGLRGQTSIADRVEFDNSYIRNWSLGLELRTVALTLAEVVRLREDRPATAKQPTSAMPRSAAKQQPAAKPALRLVHGTAEPELPASWFCGYCGIAPADGAAPIPAMRVCDGCGRGLLLEACSDAAPQADEPFLVVDSRLRVQTVSRSAEKFLAVHEEVVRDRPVADLLVGADADVHPDQSLASILGRAATAGEVDLETAFVRPRDTFGVRLPARISVCGPPRAALIVFEPRPQPPRPRTVPATLSAVQHRQS